MRRSFPPLPLLLAAALVAPALSQDVRSTPHNLSTSGPGTVKAADESEICIFCHTPHNASPQAPLWNRADPGQTYTTYTSSTQKVAPGQPSGASRLCLSCHDGTVALGGVLSRAGAIPMAGSQTLPQGRSNLGLDLSDDHPVSMSYAEAAAARGPELVANPTESGRSLLDRDGLVQCTSCHDAHDNTFGDFLRVDPVRGGLCRSCHAPTDWDLSVHATSGRSWNGSAPDPWPLSDYTTTAENACGSCHLPHKAPAPERLLATDLEEQLCLNCHNGNVAQKNIAAELEKWTAHDPGATLGDHDPSETPDGRARHAECVDCHNPHQVRAGQGGQGGLAGALQGVSGLSGSEAVLSVATREYEICYKCHADSLASDPDRIVRVADEASVLRQFDPSNPSYHPVEAAGRNSDVPSLLSGWTTASILDCTDCHNNNDAAGAGSSAPRGPHGSDWDFLLERRYETTLPTPESSAAYAMCYKCHSRTSILSDDSFVHREHLTHGAPCSSCHTAHGVDSTQGNATNNSHLINFDERYVTEGSNGRLEFVDTGRFRGNCSLTCHGEDHNAESYGGG